MGDMTTMGAAIDLLPWWVRLVWIALLAWAAASHLSHVLLMRGQPRWWHATHLLMAAGMLYMFASWQSPPIPFDLWSAVYVFAAGTIAAFIVVSRVRRDPVNLLWFLQALSMGAMAYMFELMDLTMRGRETTALTLALAALYVLEAAGWSRRWFAEADERRLSWIPLSVPLRRTSSVCASNLCGRVPVDLALSGTTMALGMSYMFLAMDLRALDFLDEALSTPTTEQTWWALTALLVALALIAPWPRTAAPTPRPVAGFCDVAGTVSGGADSRCAGRMPGSRVLLLDSASVIRAQTVCGPDGSFCFVGVEAGEYTVVATGFGEAATTWRVAPDSVGAVQLHVLPNPGPDQRQMPTTQAVATRK